MFQILSVETGKPVTDIQFPDAKEAQAFATAFKAQTGTRVRLARIVTEAWRLREAGRLADGSYVPLPAWWQAAPWWQGSVPARDHFAHMASDGARIAFTENAEKGAADIQLVLSATKYLARYFSDVLPSHEIARIGLDLRAQFFELKMSDKAEDFVKVYVEGSISSCMAKKPSYYSSKCHPVEVYATGDLHIAWIEDTSADEDEFNLIARAIVWPEKKTYTRIYYHDTAGHDQMEKALSDLGYTKKSRGFTGARLERIEQDGGFVAPYLDMQCSVTDDGDYLVIDPHGEIECDSTDGLVNAESRYSCDRCGDGMDEGDSYSVGDESWCSYCHGNHAFVCERSGESYPDSENSVEVIGRHGNRQTWHQDAANEGAFWCENTEEYYWDRYYTAVQVITNNGTETWCSEETESFHCENTDEYYSSEDFTEIEVNTESGPQNWCKEESEGDFFQCSACGEFFAIGMQHDENALFPDICPDCAAENREALILVIPEVSRTIFDYRQIDMFS